MKTRNLAIALLAAGTVFAAGSVSAQQVWSPQYEQWIDADFDQHTVCARPQSDSQEVMWDSRYETFVAADFPQHVIKPTVPEQYAGNDELVWFAEYEEFLPQNIARHTIQPGVSCPIG
jgi:hypothetical protein